MAEISAMVRDGDGARDVGARLDFLHLLAFGKREDVENGVTPSEHGLTLEDRRGAVDVIASLVNPIAPARGRVNAVELEIVAADEHPVCVALRRFDPVRRAQDLIAGLVFPERLAAGGFDGVERRVR